MLKFCILPIECVCEFRMVLTIISDPFLNIINRMVFLAGRNMFPVRYEMNVYILFGRNSAVGGLSHM
jgi:hypothetical protein